MLFFSFLVVTSSLIISILMVTSMLFMENKTLMESSGMPFECGFEPLYMTRVPVSIQYFLVLIIFLVFDLEIIIFVPLFNKFILKLSICILIFSIMMMILMMGLVMEWLEGSLEWYY
uniref:NADH dehydrogenase subunit 3 n=1 Tax=Laemobothrion maximum TaxID=2337902 RepID=UPI00257BCED9|nr:NADH dehydrogenase subunit 3 [Laemobothrion maximum]WGU50345.1 NADH dehydrogenase subunit 3 [Laemobothrion maximum]